MAWGGQFGTPGFGAGDFPPSIINQYPGTQDIQQGTQMYGNLLYGPYSNAYQIAAAQAADPSGGQFQQFGVTGGGEFGTPGAGSTELGNLFAGQAGAFNAGQAALGQQRTQAMGGMQDAFQKYAQDMFTTQSAALALDEAKARAQAEQQSAIIDLGALAATAFTGNPLFMTGAGVLTGSSQGINSPQAAQQVGGAFGPSSSSSLSGGLFSRWFGPGAAPPAGAPSPFDVQDPSAVDVTASGLYS